LPHQTFDDTETRVTSNSAKLSVSQNHTGRIRDNCRLNNNLESHFKFKRFFTDRIDEILQTSNANQWNHVPGSLNPAGEMSRGINADELRDNQRFFTGPAFLKSKPRHMAKHTRDYDTSDICTDQSGKRKAKSHTG
jgi:hypothetical protein